MYLNLFQDKLKHELTTFLDENRKYLAHQAKELICVNVSDISGSVSRTPHTIVAATYLTGTSLKQVVRECFNTAQELLEVNGVSVLNYAVDGESLFLASRLGNGTPGNDVFLARSIISKLKSFTKRELLSLVVENGNIKVILDKTDVSYEDFDLCDGDFRITVDNSITNVDMDEDQDSFSQEDIEYALKRVKTTDIKTIEKRREICSSFSIEDLRNLCLREVFPTLKKQWLRKCYGVDQFLVYLKDDILSYIPSSVFEINKYGHFTTVTFDTAHICNLLRESAAKGRLEELGLNTSSLWKLAQQSNFSFLKRILSLKGGSLEYDPMNQKSSELLLSKSVELGLESIGDFDGSKCIRVFREGILESMDVSGIDSTDRCKKIVLLKQFLNLKIDVLDKIKRAGPEEITSELYQMINCSLDSHIVSYVNIEFFNPRRKSTGTVEQFFSQLTLMNDGGSKLTCSVIQDILHRVMITNALRMLPNHVKGFSFLGQLNLHMSSYSDKQDEVMDSILEVYPRLKVKDKALNKIIPVDSNFDQQRSTRKRRALRMKHVVMDSGTGAVRKFSKKF